MPQTVNQSCRIIPAKAKKKMSTGQQAMYNKIFVLSCMHGQCLQHAMKRNLIDSSAHVLAGPLVRNALLTVYN